MGRINRRNSLGRKLVAEQGTVQRKGTVAPARQRSRDLIVVAASLLTSAGMVYRFVNAAAQGRGGSEIMVKHGAFHLVSSRVMRENLSLLKFE